MEKLPKPSACRNLFLRYCPGVAEYVRTPSKILSHVGYVPYLFSRSSTDLPSDVIFTGNKGTSAENIVR